VLGDIAPDLAGSTALAGFGCPSLHGAAGRVSVEAGVGGLSFDGLRLEMVRGGCRVVRHGGELGVWEQLAACDFIKDKKHRDAREGSGAGGGLCSRRQGKVDSVQAGLVVCSGRDSS
jgi:hypothetical protein